MKVSTVFKVLIGTIALLVLITLFVEISNVQLNAGMVNQLTTKAVTQACSLFGQETYKRVDASYINPENLVGEDGTTISGEFYPWPTAENIYENLYGSSSSNFKSWLRGDYMVSGSREILGNWSSLDAMSNALYSGAMAVGADPNNLGKIYRDNLMTPLNLGVTYLDIDVVERIARWNLSNLLLNGAMDATGIRYVNLSHDAAGDYVSYKGFRVYTSQLEITSITYEVLDMWDASGYDKFESYSNMSADYYHNTLTGADDERRYVCFAFVEYSVPVQYTGVTPIQRVANFIWNREVEGINHTMDENNDIGRTWNSSTEDMTGGGTGNSSLIVPGSIIYGVIR